MSATVTKRGAFSMQVCVPRDWPDADVSAFAERENPCGTTNGWRIRREGDPALNGCPERVACGSFPDSHVHMMLDA